MGFTEGEPTLLTWPNQNLATSPVFSVHFVPPYRTSLLSLVPHLQESIHSYVKMGSFIADNDKGAQKTSDTSDTGASTSETPRPSVAGSLPCSAVTGLISTNLNTSKSLVSKETDQVDIQLPEPIPAPSSKANLQAQESNCSTCCVLLREGLLNENSDLRRELGDIRLSAQLAYGASQEPIPTAKAAIVPQADLKLEPRAIDRLVEIQGRERRQRRQLNTASALILVALIMGLGIGISVNRGLSRDARYEMEHSRAIEFHNLETKFVHLEQQFLNMSRSAAFLAEQNVEKHIQIKELARQVEVQRRFIELRDQMLRKAESEIEALKHTVTALKVAQVHAKDAKDQEANDLFDLTRLKEELMKTKSALEKALQDPLSRDGPFARFFGAFKDREHLNEPRKAHHGPHHRDHPHGRRGDYSQRAGH